jgi:hypothetical protein
MNVQLIALSLSLLVIVAGALWAIVQRMSDEAENQYVSLVIHSIIEEYLALLIHGFSTHDPNEDPVNVFKLVSEEQAYLKILLPCFFNPESTVGTLTGA